MKRENIAGEIPKISEGIKEFFPDDQKLREFVEKDRPAWTRLPESRNGDLLKYFSPTKLDPKLFDPKLFKEPMPGISIFPGPISPARPPDG
jgi:hypothetical protein